MGLSINGRVTWQPLAQWPKAQRPEAALCEWLLDKGSLTARLVARSHDHFHVEVLRQQIARPALSEWRCLNMDRSELALIREVVLCGHQQPWVFARSVLPLTSLTGSLRHLRKQDARPLGAFLFSQPHLQRSAIAVSRLKRHHGYVPEPLTSDKPLWGRRSVFYLEDKPLLVSEVFLDAFVDTLASPPPLMSTHRQ
ncbi:chorismate--pyruvate lyase family protein [Cellvibrio sp. ARAG 10.3]|uniref:chorismate--pyruvate lyase family protein n=1 Tax=Cellvibrio sp. ARAG 10.3 TaxID=3451358 RepID=UPI003F44F282